jgi:O-antigen ligase
MFADHPWLGVGIGNYAVAYGRYALPHWYEPLGHAHNVYLNFLAETGILGTAAFASLWLASIWHALRQAGQADRARAALAIGLLGTLIYLTVHNVFDNLFVHHMQLQLALLLGMSERG